MSAISAHRAELEAIANNGAGTPGGDLPSSWTPVDLDAVLDGREVDKPPTRLLRTDGVPLLYAGKVHAISGEPESCKGWLALAAAAETMAGGETVFYVDFEDSAGGVVGRLLSLGVDPDTIRRLFVYVRPSEPLDAHGWAALGGIDAIGLGVIDGITEAMVLHGLSPDDNSDIAKWRSLLPRPLAAAGASVLEVDHVTKNPDSRGRFAIGGQHKLAQLDGAAYGVRVIDTFGRGRTGKVKIVCHKDRPGHVRAHEDDDKCVAVMTLTSVGDEGAVRVALEPPGDAQAWRPTHLMEKASHLIETYPGAGKRQIRDGVAARGEWVDAALLALSAEGYITVTPDGKSHKHFSVRPFRKADE